MKKFLWKLGWGFLYYIAIMIGGGIAIGIVSPVWSVGGTPVAALLVLAYTILPFYGAYRLVKRRAIKKHIDSPEPAKQEPVKMAAGSPAAEPIAMKTPVQAAEKAAKPQPAEKSEQTASAASAAKPVIDIKPRVQVPAQEAIPSVPRQKAPVQAAAERPPEKPPAAQPRPIQQQPEESRILLDLNAASQAELEQIPGINMIVAKKLIGLRQQGEFSSVEQAIQRLRLPEQTANEVRSRCCVTSTQRVIDF